MNLSDRMKMYESLSKTKLLPNVPTFARVDGKAFHTYARGLERPWDTDFITCMQETAKYLVEQTHCNIAYWQSDEITLMWYRQEFKSQVFFEGKVQKMASVIASMATIAFYKSSLQYLPDKRNSYPVFDCRVWTVPNFEEAVNVFVWRERDAVRNSILSLGQKYFSHRDLFNKNTDAVQELLFKEHGVNWNDCLAYQKRGAYFRRFVEARPISEVERVAIPAAHRPAAESIVKRGVIRMLDTPPMERIENKIGFIIHRENPLTKEAIL